MKQHFFQVTAPKAAIAAVLVLLANLHDVLLIFCSREACGSSELQSVLDVLSAVLGSYLASGIASLLRFGLSGALGNILTVIGLLVGLAFLLAYNYVIAALIVYGYKLHHEHQR